MEKLYRNIGVWSNTTFPNAKPEHHLLKCKQEIDEAINEPENISEYADCFIALISGCNRAGFVFSELVLSIEKKLNVNKLRQWNENKDGTHQHK